MAELTFYFDRNFGRRLPEASKIVLSDVAIEYHHGPGNRFNANTPDDEWLSIVGAKRWIVFSHDRKFHAEQPCLSAIKQHNIGCFYLWGAEASVWEKLRCFSRGYDKIVEISGSHARPFIFEVAKGGTSKEILLP